VVIFVRTAGRPDLIDAARNAFHDDVARAHRGGLDGAAANFGWQWSLDRSIGQVSYGSALQVLGETQEALKWFELALSGGLSPLDEVDARQRAAQCLALSGELAGARVHLTRALALDPANDVTREMLRRLDGLAR
jgi:Tfp pilus assembly protein PilF